MRTTSTGSRQRSSARSRAKRNQIRAGALRVFVDQGFAAASTDAIATEAGVSKQTLYAYYRSKEDLLVDVLSEFVRTIDNPGLDSHHPVDSFEALRAALRSLAVDTLEALTRDDHLAIVRIIIHEIPRMPRVGEIWAHTIPGRIRAAVSELLTRARTEGVVRPIPVEPATRLFVGALLTYVVPDGLQVPKPDRLIPTPDELDQIIDLYLPAIT